MTTPESTVADRAAHDPACEYRTGGDYDGNTCTCTVGLTVDKADEDPTPKRDGS